MDDHAGNVLVLAGHVVEHLDSQLDGERNQPGLVGLERLEHGLAHVVPAFQHGHRTAFEGQARRVLELDAAERVLGPGLFIVEEHGAALELAEHDRHERGLVAADRDRVLDLVREQVAQLPLADMGGRRAERRRRSAPWPDGRTRSEQQP